MLALLKKDLFVLRKTCAAYIGVLLFYVAFGAISGNFAMFQIFFTLAGLMLPVTSMSYDERSKWDVYGMSLPVSRRAVVLSKYIFTMGAILVGVGVSAVLSVVYAEVNGAAMTFELLVQPLLFACVGLVMTDVGLPLMFKLGTEKGRYAMVGLIWGIAFIPVIVVKMFSIDVYEIAADILGMMAAGGIAAALFAATAVITVISVWFSIAVYERKELC